MNWECLSSVGDAEEWVTCTVLDSYTSPTHWYVRRELGSDSDHVWLPVDRVRRINLGSANEPSY